MKRIRTLAISSALVVIIGGSASAQVAGPEASLHQQQQQTARNGLHVNPLQMALGVFGLGYERVFGNHVAMQINAQYTKLWFSDDDVWAVGGQIKPMLFFFRPAPGGMYISPFFSGAYSRATQKGSDVVGEGFGYSVGATIGYSWVIGRHFNIRAGGGVQYFDIGAKAEGGGAKVTIGFAGIMPALDFSLGYLF